ncbi:MAG: hypothetical protein ACOCZE_06875 [Planctomycetota bacterium]
MKERFDKSDPEFRLVELLDAGDGQLESLLGRKPELAEQVRLYRALDDHLEQLPEIPVDQDTLDQQRQEIMARLERRVLLDGPARRRRFGPLRLWLGGLAAAALVVLGVSIILNTMFQDVVVRSQPVVQVRLRTPAAGGAESARASTVRVSTRREIDFEQMPLAPDYSDSPGALPQGTVMFSTGRPARSPSPRPEEYYPL